jgi:alkanesulfonate monooxygenase SsuD/methylene tetrahydromethanopterin reductase-like flavin-dependent oxidoreductase (luciferase family)
MEFWTGGGLAKSRVAPNALANNFDAYVRGAAEAEKLGFDGYSSSEHHFMYDSFLPFPLEALAAAAAVTSKIRLVTGVMLLTLYDPLEAAEYAATVDVLSDGRLTLGLGMGYRPMEFDGLALEKKTRGARLTEEMEVLRLATSQEKFCYHGKHYQYEDAGLKLRSVQRPIDMWFGSGTSAKGAKRAGDLGLGYWLANTPFATAEENVAAYRAAGRDAGWPEESLRFAVFKDLCIGSTIAEAEELREYALENFYDEHILGYGYLVDDDGNHLYNVDHDHPIYQRFVDSLFCGTPEMVIEEIKRYEDLGAVAMQVGSMQREVFAKEVMPAFS